MADNRNRARARARAKPPQGGPAPAPGAPAPAPSSGPPPGQPRPVASSTGRATHRGAGRSVDESVSGITSRFSQVGLGGNGNGGGGNGSSSGMSAEASVGRGNMRGKRVICNIVRTRPETAVSKKGTSGQPVRLQANFFKLLSKTDWCLYQYRVDFDPAIDLTGERKKLLRDHKALFNGQYLFDGTVLFVTIRLKESQEVYSARESDGSQIRITIREVGELMVGDAHYLQVFNIITRNALRKLDLQMIKRDYFDPKAKVSIPSYCLELWPGYSTTIRQHENGILLNANIEHKVMRTDTCLQLLRDIVQRNPRDYKTEFATNVVGTVVLTDYNNKTYTISDINWSLNPSSTFDRNGTQTSYINYYRERYNINICDGRQPLLVSKSRPRDRRAREQQAVETAGSQDPNIILLIPELCRMTGITDEMRSNFNLMKELATHTRIGPADRIQRLLTMNQRLNQEPRVKEEFQSWNMALDQGLIELNGRIMPAEGIVLGREKVVPSGDDCDWTRHLRSNPMFSMPQNGLSRWVIIYPERLDKDVGSFVDTLMQAGKGMQFYIAQPEYAPMRDDRNQTYIQFIDQAIANCSPELIFCVLMSNKADKYSAIKKRSLVDRAVPTQVLLAKNLTKKGVMSIATKVAIQLNCKIGGAPWSIQVPLPSLMVIGFDVCHDSKSKGKSFGAMVASLNKPMSRYFSAVSHHSTGEELSNDLALNIIKALQSYRKYNNRLPTHIMIYRDGVGDGQIPYVFEHEVQRINAAIKELYESMPKVGFILVSKRINTRVFANKQNPRPGTVIDDVITLPERYDFFIVSQHVTQGTVSPTSYNVIHDTLGLDPDKVQRLSFKLTHSYYNWSGTVRVPAPVQYAHKLAFLVSQSLNRPPNSGLEELLYFL